MQAMFATAAAMLAAAAAMPPLHSATGAQIHPTAPAAVTTQASGGSRTSGGNTATASSNTGAVLPASTAAPTAQSPFVLGYYLPGNGSQQSLAAHYQDISAIAPLWFGIHSDGSVQHRSGGSLAAIVNQAHSLGRKVFVLVTNMAQDRILVNAAVRQTAVQNLVRTVLQNHLDGVNIDFESIDGTDAQGLVAFVSAVHQLLAPHGILTTVAVGPRSSSQLPLSDQSDAYDYAALGRVSDYVVLMTYDEHCPPGGAGPIAGLPWVTKVVNFAITQMPASKILLGIAAYGYDWAQPGIPTVTASQAMAQISSGLVKSGWSQVQEEPYYTSSSHDVWFEDSQSAVPKFAMVREDHLGGIALWYLGAEDSQFWPAVQADLLK